MRTMIIWLVVASATLSWAQEKKTPSRATAVQPAPVQFQPLNVRTGLWENSLTTTLSGDSMVPAGLLSKLSPERRAKMEARMRERAGAGGHTTTYQSCITAKELKETPFADKQNCKETLLSSTSTSAQIKLSCNLGDGQASGTMQIQATSDTTVEGSGNGTATTNGQTTNISSTLKGHWVAADCGDVQ